MVKERRLPHLHKTSSCGHWEWTRRFWKPGQPPRQGGRGQGTRTCIPPHCISGSRWTRWLVNILVSRAQMGDLSWIVAYSSGGWAPSLHPRFSNQRHCSLGFSPRRVGRAQAGTGGVGSPVGRNGSGWTREWSRPAHRWLSRVPRLCSILDRIAQGVGEQQGQKPGVLGRRKRGQHHKVRA